MKSIYDIGKQSSNLHGKGNQKKTTKNKVEDSYNISDIVYQSISVTNNRQPGTGDLLSMLFYCRRWCRWWYVVDI